MALLDSFTPHQARPIPACTECGQPNIWDRAILEWDRNLHEAGVCVACCERIAAGWALDHDKRGHVYLKAGCPTCCTSGSSDLWR